jgi:hypothetical protein
MQTIVLLPAFERDAKAAGVTDEELQAMLAFIARAPLAGDLMAGTGGARKLRHRKEGSGKSGGYRTIHYFAGEDLPIFMIAIFAKGEKDNLSKAERNEVARLLPILAATYARSGR